MLTTLTQQLKQATDQDDKNKVINSVKSNPIFKEIKDSIEAGTEVVRAPKSSVDNEEVKEALLQQSAEQKKQQKAILQKKGSDEIEELKKIFYEFFVEDSSSASHVNYNEQRYYEKPASVPVIKIMQRSDSAMSNHTTIQ